MPLARWQSREPRKGHALRYSRIGSRRGHERSECFGAYHCSAASNSCQADGSLTRMRCCSPRIGNCLT